MLDRRSARYRSLVIIVSLGGLAVPTSALILWDWLALLGWLLIVPAVGVFLVLDARSVARWRGALLGGWVAGVLDLDGLQYTFASIRQLPEGTLAGMFDPLPTRTRLGIPSDPPPTIRESLAATVQAIDVTLVKGMVVGVVALTGTIALLGAAVALGSLWPLAGLPLSIVLSRGTRQFGACPPRRWVRKVIELMTNGSDFATFAALSGRLAWESLPPAAQQNWLRTLQQQLDPFGRRRGVKGTIDEC